MIERYSRPEMRALWTDEARYGFWLRVELAVCEVLAERGVIPAASLVPSGIVEIGRLQTQEGYAYMRL